MRSVYLLMALITATATVSSAKTGSANSCYAVQRAHGRAPTRARVAHHTLTAVLKKLPVSAASGTDCGPKPNRLYPSFDAHKEYPPFFRHAWGRASVSTKPDHSDEYQVDRIRFVIRMPQPAGGDGFGNSDCQNAGHCDSDVSYSGSGAFGDFMSHWRADADEPCYAHWATETDW